MLSKSWNCSDLSFFGVSYAILQACSTFQVNEFSIKTQTQLKYKDTMFFYIKFLKKFRNHSHSWTHYSGMVFLPHLLVRSLPKACSTSWVNEFPIKTQTQLKYKDTMFFYRSFFSLRNSETAHTRGLMPPVWFFFHISFFCWKATVVTSHATGTILILHLIGHQKAITVNDKWHSRFFWFFFTKEIELMKIP